MLVALTASAKTWNITPDKADTLRVTVNAAAAGDTIVMAAGTYTMADQLIFQKNLCIKAANSDSVIVKQKYWSELSHGAKLYVDGIYFDGSSCDNRCFRVNDAIAGNELHLRNCHFYRFPKDVIAVDNGDYRLDSLVIDNCHFHDFVFSAIHIAKGNVSSQQPCYGVKVTNSTFANIDASKEFRSVIQVCSYNYALTNEVEVLVDHCTFYNYATRNTDYGAVTTRQISNSTVSNCIMYHDTLYDRYATACYAGTVKNCLSYHYVHEGHSHRSGPTRTDTIYADPLFTDAANGNYTLAENSPAKGAGVGGSHLGDPRWWNEKWAPVVVVDVTSVTLDKKEMTIGVYETAYLHTTVLPDNASDPTVSWKSNNTAVATVVDGAVKGIAAGTAKIIATAGAFSDTCEVTVSAAIPSTDFATPHFLMGTKALLEGNILVTEADSLTYPDSQEKGTATWKVYALNGGFITATANFKTGSSSGAKLRLVILDADENQVGDTLKQDRHDEDGDVAFPGFIVLPEEGTYTIKLLNAQTWSRAKLRGITLTKDATKDVVFMCQGDSWAERPATIAQDGLSASATIVLPAGDYEFIQTVGGEYRANGWWLKPEGPTSATGVTGNSGINMKVCPAFNLEHTFTWTYATNTIEVTFPEVTVYFVNESNWTTVKAYAWREARTDNPKIENAAWSGVAMTKTDTKSDGHDVYSYTTSAYKNLIFNDGGSNQTGDLAIDPAKPYYYAGDWHETLPGAPTAIDNTVVGEKAVKLMENGQIVIIKNGVRYNVLGTVIK